jgi:hypothetical protein
MHTFPSKVSQQEEGLLMCTGGSENQKPFHTKKVNEYSGQGENGEK